MSLEASVTLLYIIDWSREVSLLAFFIAYTYYYWLVVAMAF